MTKRNLLSSLLLPLLISGNIIAQNTTTVTFKPGAAVGEALYYFGHQITVY